MTDHRPIATGDLKAPESGFKPGPAPMLQWLKIADLVVDDRYQRPIYGAGHRNVREIAERFSWSKFAPLIVAPVEGGKFAVIDGQHRATAAALRGLESVPAQVIIADEIEQAAAFKAVNGQVTRMHKLAVQHAALMAGDADALAIKAACDAAGVAILRYPVALPSLKPGETLALGAVKEALKSFGHDALVTAMMCVTETSNNRPGLLAADIIKAVCAALASNERWRDGGEALFAAFDVIDLEDELEEARCSRRAKGVAVWEVLADRIKAILRDALPMVEVAP
ncbi:ParB N-terminal domain-containing protein [Brevundimonas sp.]|uniref:ParB N-terminal domain-containing protein n=1 Tax=Brevundimonas sp. TaxID=1871086 RepID=UPI00286ABFE1|nr:ParB N-terminal domain-containing protein [Brevundimonas sp.]